ncbi:HBL/NHE enterotoxin family protein [Jeotgalibacillus marinus]|uniref:HBL/NHE enterotoxin family protein n=1 Tax=Jeotgalibacillus marinus TaxID=86667 RepID=A0ABV3Q656_9BACL
MMTFVYVYSSNDEMKITKKVLTTSVLALAISTSSIPYNVLAKEVVPSGEIQQDEAISLDPSEIGNRAQQLIADKISLDIYANTILSQGTIKDLDLNDGQEIKHVPINEHQQSAKENATYWQDELEPELIRRNLDIKDFSLEYQNYYDTLYGLLDNFRVDDFKTVIAYLQEDISTHVASTDETIQLLTDFKNAISVDSTNLKDDKGVIDLWVGVNGEDGKAVEQLNRDIASYEQGMDELRNTLILEVIGGATLSSVLLIGAPIVFALAPEASPWLIGGMVTGGLLTAGGTAAGGVLIQNQIGNLNKEYHDALYQLNDLQAQSATAKIVEEQVSLMVDQIDNAIVAIRDIRSTWVTIGDDFSNLTTHLDNSADRVLVAKNELEVAFEQWTDIERQTDLLNAFGNAQTVDDLDSYQFNAPNNFVANIDGDRLDLQWNKPTYAESIDGDNITYSILLDGKVIESGLSDTSITITGADKFPTGDHEYAVRAFDGIVYSNTAFIQVTK